MNIKESELRKKLDLVVDKLLNLGGPDNAKELEESGGEAIGFFARDFGIKEWDWPQGVGLYGLLKIMQYDKNEKYKEFLHDWFVENMEMGLPSRNINTTTPLLTLAELNEYYHDEKFEKLCLDWADWLMNCIPRTKEGGFQHVTSANGDRQGVRLNESSCPLPISAFSIVPDFVVFVVMEPRSRSHPHPPAQNTSSIPPLRCFRTIYSIAAPRQIQILLPVHLQLRSHCFMPPDHVFNLIQI